MPSDKRHGESFVERLRREQAESTAELQRQLERLPAQSEIEHVQSLHAASLSAPVVPFRVHYEDGQIVVTLIDPEDFHG